MQFNPKDKPPENKDRIRSEISYRRGYVQGVEAAINVLTNGGSAGKLEIWLSNVLRKWNNAPKDKPIKPPTP